MLAQLSADEKFADEVLKVTATPTFFINGERIKGAIPFEAFDKRIKQLLQNWVVTFESSMSPLAVFYAAHCSSGAVGIPLMFTPSQRR
jgi:hypothetical protein